MTVSSSVIQTNISTWKRDITNVPVFGIINFKFVNISHTVWNLFLIINCICKVLCLCSLDFMLKHSLKTFQNISKYFIYHNYILTLLWYFTLNDQKRAIYGMVYTIFSINIQMANSHWFFLKSDFPFCHFLLFSKLESSGSPTVTGMHVWHDNTVALTAFLILLLQTDNTDHCNHQHYSQYRQRRGKCKGGFVHDGALVLTAVPIVPPVITHHTPGEQRKRRWEGKIWPEGILSVHTERT